MSVTLSPKLAAFWISLQQLPLSALIRPLQWLLVILAAFLLARLSWQLLPVPAQPALQVNATSSMTATRPASVQLNELLQHALFGTLQAEPVASTSAVAITEAPKTQLNVKLTGLVAVPNRPDAGSAIIEYRGAETTYAVGDTLDGTRAKLYQVLEDRVLLEQNGRFETLMLDGVEFTRIAQANAGLGQSDNPGDVVAVEEPIVLAEPIASGVINPDVQARRDEILAEPMKFFDYVRVSPVQRDGQLVGYRLMPGKDADVFAQMGLQQNDLAIEINGIPLNDMQQAMRVINELREATEATLKIERDGEIRDILFSLSQ
jgi:general secretion pathway protein C